MFKIKNEGRLRDRLVGLGYRQKAGIDYRDIHAPVLSEVALRIILMIKMVSGWTCCKVDVEAGFLDSVLDETIFIELPEGLDHLEHVLPDEVGKLNAALYGFSQALRAFYLKLRVYLVQELNYKVCPSEPCLIINEEIILGMYVDDILVIWSDHAVSSFLKYIKKGFKVREFEKVNEFVGCEMNWNNKESEVTLHQTRIVDKLLRNFDLELK